ncbi:hypothetical protein ACE1ET_13680 [Saccharicrinis sp. FJH62]|uniref:hypothetical protein n=1 Tax=Saccharicrinis sp. FJH62 TaxID=3344657 RepID=UPI0035D4157C
MKQIVSLVFLIILSSCSLKEQNCKKHYNNVLIHYYVRGNIKNTDSVNLITCINNDTISYTFIHDTDTLAYSYRKSAKSDSSIIFFGIPCPLITTKQIVINDTAYIIKKYLYDKIDVSDEEANLFYCENYGLLVGYSNFLYGLTFSIDYDSISEKLIHDIISDRTGFYENYFVPPPPLEEVKIKISKENLFGAYGGDEETENAYFGIYEDSIYYPDPDIWAKYELKGDTIVIINSDNSIEKLLILKLTTDSLIVNYLNYNIENHLNKRTQ